jgi:hypothetical protein
MVGDCDDDQFVITELVENAVRPSTQRVTAYASPDLFAYFFELKKQLKLAFHGFHEEFAVAPAMLVVVIARFQELATSLITND